MGIKVALPDIDGIMASKVKEIEDAIVYNLSYVGERCVNEARTGYTYTDRTGNLTSSMGYVLVKDGQVIKQSSFEKVKDGDDGVKRGPDMAREIAAQTSKGIALIVVAGMNYARYVADRGFNVLASAEILAEKLVPQLMRRLGYERR